MRTLFLQEILRRGVLGQSYVISAAHTDADVAQTVEAARSRGRAYRKALETGRPEELFDGRPGGARAPPAGRAAPAAARLTSDVPVRVHRREAFLTTVRAAPTVGPSPPSRLPATGWRARSILLHARHGALALPMRPVRPCRGQRHDRANEHRHCDRPADRAAGRQHDPHAVDGRGAGGELRASRARRWRWRPVAYAAVAALPALRPGAAGVGQPGPVRAVGRARVDAAVLDAAPGRGQVGEPGLRDRRRAGRVAGGPERFRQLDSKCPGHPEYRWTSGVECTTGPLGTGIATSVGMAIAGLWQAATFNRPGYDLFDYDVYALAGDGCLMEGIGAEAASLAGHLKLANLCWIYDNNRITIEGATSLAFSEDVPARFAGYGWAVQHVSDANDLDALGAAFEAFRAETGKPTLIVVDSVIGYGAPTQAGHARRARRAAGRGRDQGDQAVLRLAGGREVPGAGRGGRARPGRDGRARRRRCAGSGRSCSPATPPSTRSRPSSSTTCSGAPCPTAGTPTSRASPPTPRAWPAATPAARCSTRSRSGCRG